MWNMSLKINNFFIILLFLSAVTLPLVFSNKVGGEKSETENRYLATFPDIVTKDMKLSPGVKVGLENWINDNAGFRTQFQKFRTDFEYYVFHISPSNLVHIGEDGWFYYTGDNDLKIAEGDYPLTQQMLEKIKDNQVKIQNALSRSGIEYVIVFTPSKPSVYPEYLKGGKFFVKNTVIDIVSDYLRKNTTIPIINTKDNLLSAKDSGLVYFKTDSHWNESGAYVGYTAIINSLQQLGMVHSGPVKITTYPSTRKGEFSAMMGDINLLPAESYNATQIISPNAVSIQDGNYYNQMMKLTKLDKAYGYYSYQNNNAEKKKTLIYGDSYFGAWEMTQLLAENFSNLDFVWSDVLKENVVEQSKPDIVIMERTERYIFTLANDPDPSLINKPLVNPSAEIISTTTPGQINRNKKYDINITVKNTSKTNWSKDNGVQLCIFQDGKDNGYRVFLPYDVIIKPGEEFIFILKDFQAPPNNSTNLEYQMVQEGIQYFGEKKRVDITIK
jgi:alginate O-acetyltransferase complex protein AlgJ